MSIDDRLRSAIRARTSRVESSPGALQQIEEKLMQANRGTNRRRLLVGVGAAAAVVAVVIGILVVTADDDSQDLDVAGTSTTVDQTTSTLATSTTEATTPTTVVDPTVDPAVPIWPRPDTSQRFDSPQAVARSFAVDLLGFVDPVIGPFQAGDSRSGEVEVRSFADGRPTTVAVRQLEDDTWFVLAASVESIRLDQPAAGGTIASPLPLAGAASAFEGHIDVRLFADGVTEPIGETFVTGRGDGEMGDFTGELTFEVPDGVRHGVLVLFEPSAKDGSTIAATVLRVHF